MMNLQKKNICLVDDDRIYQFTARKILESTGKINDIQAFYNGEDALAFLQTNTRNADILPDVIFLDINIPVLDGRDFLKESEKMLPSFPKKIIVYMVSSSVDDSDIKRSEEFGTITAYVIKPVSKERFEQLLDEAVNAPL